MSTEHHRFRALLISLIAGLILAAVGYLILIKVIDLDTYKGQILTELQKALHRPVSYRTGNLSFSLGPAVTFHDVTVREPDNSTDFVTIRKLTCRLDLLPLFKKQIVVHGIVADNATITIDRRTDGKYNISDLTEGDSGSSSLKINQIKLNNALITVMDRFPQQTPVITRLEKTDLFLEDVSRGHKGNFKLSTRLGGGASGVVGVNGKLKLSPAGSPLETSSIEAKLSCKQLDSAHYWPYYSRFVPFKKLLGSLDAEVDLKGKLNAFQSQGRLSWNSGRLDYLPVFRQVLTVTSARLKYSMKLDERDITIDRFELAIDGAEIKGGVKLQEYRSKDPRISAQAVTSKLDFARYKQFIPYGIIVKDTGDWIEQHLAGGVFQLDEGRLDGKISQILHMESGSNYNVLYIKARVENGVISYGAKVPTFNTVKGTLEMKGKDFLLHGMSGKFGNSPMTLEGRITDYPLDTPSGYPFRMVISPAKNEVAWLIGKERSSHLSYDGNSTLALNGDGFTSGYNLSGDWNLTPATYAYANYLTKQAGTPSQLRFKGTITPKETILSSLNFTIGESAFTVSAKYPFEQGKDFSLTVHSNPLTLESLAKQSPALTQYQPSGRTQISLKGTLPHAAENFTWRGNLSAINASFRYSPIEKPVSAINGSIYFEDNSMESSQLSASIGSSSFSGKGAIASLTPLTFSTSFTAQRIDLTDFGFKFPQKAPLISRVKADVTYKENSLTIRSLTGNLNKSQLSIRGAITDIEKFKADVSATATYLDIADLVLFQGIEKIAGKQNKPVPEPTIKATMKADKAVFSGAEFEHLTGTLSLANKSLQLQQVEGDFLGGKLSAKGKIDAQSTSPTHYQGSFKLINVSADRLTDFFYGKKQDLSGIMSFEGSMAAVGDSYEALKKSAEGSLKVHCKKGMIRQFPWLSKIFSILNVSQLFSFQLPDMVSEGMPYTEINGNMEVKNGFISTKDLFVSSNAMNISIIGKSDFINNTLDLTVGVQPLQTVDKVVSRIPIVGWILTGKEKSLVSTYFEVKGKATEPNVSAIPISSLGKGILGIFKRVFQLPEKLITDTGEVILNK